MADAQTALAQVREALAAGPTPGPWVTMPANAGVHCVARINAWEAVPPSDCELSHDSIDASFIAACSPANMTAILAHVKAQEAEIERLRDLLRVEQALALRQDPFRCYDIECQWFGRPVRAGDCQCHHLQATTHRANVRDALANRSSDE